MGLFRIAIFVFVSCLIGCASGPEIVIDYSTSTDFSNYKTYRWYDDVVASKDAEYRKYNSQDKRVRKYFNQELKRLGYNYLDAGEPDFLINYHISKEDNLYLDQFSNYSSRGVHGAVSMGTYGSSVAIGYSSGSKPRVYKNGTVVIDIINATKNEVVWRGIAEGRLPKDLSPPKRDLIADKLAKKLMGEFYGVGGIK